MISTIVVAIDGSAHQDKVLALAGAEAKAHGARLVLAHGLLRAASYAELYDIAERHGFMAQVKAKLDDAATPPPIAPSAAMGGAIPVVIVPVETLEAVGEGIAASARRTLEPHGITVDSRMLDAGGAEAVLETARAEGADLIVIGSRGLGRLSGLVLGSVSQKVLHDAECACLVVK